MTVLHKTRLSLDASGGVFYSMTSLQNLLKISPHKYIQFILQVPIVIDYK